MAPFLGGLRTARHTWIGTSSCILAEVCRRRNGIIAQGLPEEVVIGQISCESEVIPADDGRDRTVSVLKIELDGHGSLPDREEE